MRGTGPLTASSVTTGPSRLPRCVSVRHQLRRFPPWVHVTRRLFCPNGAPSASSVSCMAGVVKMYFRPCRSRRTSTSRGVRLTAKSVESSRNFAPSAYSSRTRFFVMKVRRLLPTTKGLSAARTVHVVPSSRHNVPTRRERLLFIAPAEINSEKIFAKVTKSQRKAKPLRLLTEVENTIATLAEFGVVRLPASA